MLFEKHWHISDKPLPPYLTGYIWIFCPNMETNGHSLKVKREGFKEFLRLEKHIVENLDGIGWVAGVHLPDAHIMRWASRMGARPFDLTLNEDKLWFIKCVRKQGDYKNVR